MGKAKVKKPAKRRPAKKKKAGRPKPEERKIVPDDYELMSMQYGKGVSMRQIARQMDVQPNTVAHHFKTHIFPMVQNSACRSLTAVLLKLDTMFRVAWECFESDDPAEVREIAKKLTGKIKDRPGRFEKLVESTISTLEKNHDRSWLLLALSVLQEQCKLAGHYAAVKFDVDVHEYRVAGQSPAEHERSMMDYIIKQARERTAYEKRLAAAGVNFGRIDNLQALGASRN